MINLKIDNVLLDITIAKTLQFDLNLICTLIMILLEAQ